MRAAPAIAAHAIGTATVACLTIGLSAVPDAATTTAAATHSAIVAPIAIVTAPAAAIAPSPPPTAPSVSPAGSLLPALGTGWTWPLGDGPPVVVRGFDPPDLPWQPGHRGVDLLGSTGVTVNAAGSGVVTYAGPVAGVGVVTVTHGELRTTYQPVTATVVAGDRVSAGEPIGTLSPAGSHCAPSACLHWGLLRGTVYLDPVSLVLGTARPRLLPLGRSALAPAAAPEAGVTVTMPHGAEPHQSALLAGARGALAGVRG
jgi:murein DD-endopeptidase MepM/ murein hydrolase activator NlpD